MNPFRRKPASFRPWEDATFKSLLKASGNRIDPQRAYVLLNTLEACLPLDGQVCECGVYKGASAYLLASLLARRSPTKELWLYDTFSGTPAGTINDPIERRGLYNDTSEDFVRKHLKDLPIRINIIPGLLPESLKANKPEPLCFAHLHLNLYQSTSETLAALWNLLNPQGMVLVEDYGIRNCDGVLKATEEFCSSKSLARLILPTGQALILKR
jgi:hypothetical protein